MILAPVATPEDVEWLRVHRNDPRLYKYFRQDKPITPEQQAKWWMNLDKKRVRLYLIKDKDKTVGYCGFNPLSMYARSAEFGVFVIPEEQKNGYAEWGLKQLLSIGFNTLHLSTIYSDCLDYPGENRFGFYAKMGFVAHPKEHQNIRYMKQGKWVPSIKFYMTNEMYQGRYGQKTADRVAVGKP